MRRLMAYVCCRLRPASFRYFSSESSVPSPAANTTTVTRKEDSCLSVEIKKKKIKEAISWRKRNSIEKEDYISKKEDELKDKD